MEIEDIVRTPEYQSVVADYKDTCLWSAAECDHPKNRMQLDYVLRCIETYGDLLGYRRVGRIRQWL